MERLRVVLVTGIFPPDIGGPATFIPQLANFLLKQGHKVKVLTLFSPEMGYSMKADYPVNRTSRKINFPIRVILIVAKMVFSFVNSDRVISNGLYLESAIANLLSRKVFICKVVGDPVWERYRNETNSKVQIDQFETSNLSIKWKLQRLVIRWSLNQADLVITPSLQLKRLIEGWGVVTEVQIIPNGTYCYKQRQNNDFEYDVVSISRLVNWKNIDILIQACALNNMTLAVAGSGPEEIQLRELAQKLNARVTFLGHLDEKSSQELMMKSRIFALISSYEGMSFTLIEAMMHGMRILVSANDGNLEVIESGKNGQVVYNLSPQEVAQGLLSLFQSEQNHLGDEARRNANERNCLTNILMRYEKTLAVKAK